MCGGEIVIKVVRARVCPSSCRKQSKGIRHIFLLERFLPDLCSEQNSILQLKKKDSHGRIVHIVGVIIVRHDKVAKIVSVIVVRHDKLL